MIKHMLFTAAASIAVLPAVAGPASVEFQLRQCRAEVDSLKRLACYDGVVLPSPAPAPAPAAATVTPARAPAALAAGAAPSEQRFGLPVVPAPAPATASPQAIESQIEGRFLGWRPGELIRLRNGQVWEVADDSAAAYTLTDPKVRVVRGRFGGFFLHIEGVSQTPRVRRFQ